VAEKYDKQRAALANAIYTGASEDELANANRDISKIVTLTQAAYDALPVKDPNTIYITVN